MMTIIDFLPFIWYTIGCINGTLPLKRFPRLFPGKSFPGKKPGSTLKSRLKYQRLPNPKCLD